MRKNVISEVKYLFITEQTSGRNERTLARNFSRFKDLFHEKEESLRLLQIRTVEDFSEVDFTLWYCRGRLPKQVNLIFNSDKIDISGKTPLYYRMDFGP